MVTELSHYTKLYILFDVVWMSTYRSSVQSQFRQVGVRILFETTRFQSQSRADDGEHIPVACITNPFNISANAGARTRGRFWLPWAPELPAALLITAS